MQSKNSTEPFAEKHPRLVEEMGDSITNEVQVTQLVQDRISAVLSDE